MSQSHGKAPAWTEFTVTWTDPAVNHRIRGPRALAAVAGCTELLNGAIWHYKYACPTFLRVNREANSLDVIALTQRLNRDLAHQALVQGRSCDIVSTFEPEFDEPAREQALSMWHGLSRLLCLIAVQSSPTAWPEDKRLRLQVAVLRLVSLAGHDAIRNFATECGVTDKVVLDEAISQVVAKDYVQYVLPPDTLAQYTKATIVHYMMNSVWASDLFPHYKRPVWSQST